MKISNINTNLLLNKRLVIGVLLAGIMTVPGCSNKSLTKEEKAKAKGINYSNMFYGSISEESNDFSFSLADCGNYRVGLSVNASTLLGDSTLPTGIIIRSTATSESEIYNDIDYVKDLIVKYDVDYPVFLDVDKLFELNSDLNTNSLVSIFYNKLQANGLYVSIMGKKENLNKINDVSEIDKMLVLDENKLDGPVKYNMVSLKDQFIVSGIEYDYIINEYNFNDEKRFVKDFVYYINDGETIWELSSLLDINENLIMDYNKIDDETKISVGTRIVIPSIYGEELEVAKEKVKTIK